MHFLATRSAQRTLKSTTTIKKNWRHYILSHHNDLESNATETIQRSIRYFVVVRSDQMAL